MNAYEVKFDFSREILPEFVLKEISPALPPYLETDDESNLEFSREI
jgi:hypothetical protein